MGSIHLDKEEKPLDSVYIPYMKGILEKFQHIGNHYNIRTIFKVKHTLMSSLMRTRPKRDLHYMAHWICSIPCECGSSYISEIDR
jgi:hypothetical protein